MKKYDSQRKEVGNDRPTTHKRAPGFMFTFIVGFVVVSLLARVTRTTTTLLFLLLVRIEKRKGMQLLLLRLEQHR